MEHNKTKAGGSEATSSNLKFEEVNGNENLFVAISYNENGKKQEVFFTAISEEQFDKAVAKSKV